jgi:hypothetical protein
LSIDLVKQLSDRFEMSEGDMPTWVEVHRGRGENGGHDA